MKGMMMLSGVLVILALGITHVAGAVLDLTASDFHKVIDRTKPALVEFYASWCGHCKNLKPIYDELGTAFDHAKDKVQIARIDVDIHKAIGSEFGVSGYPTLKWFPAGSKAALEDYKGGRELKDFADFIKSKTGLMARLPKAAPTTVVSLTAENWNSYVGSKNVLVEFFAPWCGHCKSLAPIYESLAKTFLTESECVVASVEATSETELAERFDVKGFPTIKFFPKGSSDPIEYAGGRSEEDLVNFLNLHCQTARAAGGNVSPTMGLVPELEPLVQEFMTSTDQRQQLVDSAKSLVESNKAQYSHIYIRVMEGVLKKGDKYLDDELDRIGKILGKSSIAPESKDTFMVRRNIVSLFKEVAGGNTGNAPASDAPEEL